MSSPAATSVLAPSGAGATRERILAAAELCMSRLGMAKFSMHDVATQAGLSRGAVYLHFKDRGALVDTVLTRAAERFVAGSAVAIDKRRTLAAQVGEAAVFIRQHLGDQVLTLRLPADDETLFATMLTSRLEHVAEEWVEFWRPYLDDAIGRGEIQPGIDRRQAGEWIVRLLLTFAVMPGVTFDADRPDQVRAFVRSFVVAGLLGPHTSEREEST